MAFGFVAACYIAALLLSIILIFFTIYLVIAFDELKTDYKNPIDVCKNLNPVCIYIFKNKWHLLF